MATVPADDITIGGERSVKEFLTKMVSRKYEIKKPVIGEDADFEKSRRMLNRVIEWRRDGITIEADQRHVREILKDLELERGNRSATPRAVERKNEGGARSDESKGENRCGKGQTQTKHKWEDRPQMADDDANESQALTGDDITRCTALVARISYLSQDRPDLKFASMPACVRWQDHQCVTWSVSRGSEDASLGSREQSAGSVGCRVASWKRIRRLTGEPTNPLDHRCQPGSSWAKKQQVVSLSTAESELYAAVKTASEGLGIQSVANDVVIACRLNLHLDASATMCLVNCRGLGKAKYRRHPGQKDKSRRKSARA